MDGDKEFETTVFDLAGCSIEVRQYDTGAGFVIFHSTNFYTNEPQQVGISATKLGRLLISVAGGEQQ
jgi:hypothetical protein